MNKITNLEICMWAINVPETLELGCKTFNEKSLDIKTYDCILYMNVDPYPNNENIEQMDKLAKTYFKTVKTRYGTECFVTKAVYWVFSQVINDVFFSWVGGRTWHGKSFSLNKMYNNLINDDKAVQVCMFCHPNKIYADYLMDPCTLCKTNFYKNIYLPNYSIWLCNEYQLREIGLLENALCKYYENDNNLTKYYGEKWISNEYKKKKNLYLGNASLDEEIDKIIEENGEWHQIIYDKYKKKPNTNKTKLDNMKKKTLNKKWIYRWTGLRVFVSHDDKIYKRHL